MEPPKARFRVSALLALALIVPCLARAADEAILLASHRGDSTLQRKINALDDDREDEFPIPVLFGVRVRDLTENFADPRDGGDRSHEGLDIMAPRGAYVVSPTEAVVRSIGTGDRSGKYVYTANPGDETFRYMHLDDVADGLRVGDELDAGDLIGYVGNTGNASGGAPHLHFETRGDDGAEDPFPRLDREFTTKERVAAVEQILEDSGDADDEAEELVRLYRPIFLVALADKIELPEEIAEALGLDATPVAASPTVASSTAASPNVFPRDLTLGARGDDVALLQLTLVNLASGPKAKELEAAGATGYFGPLTQAALAEYQAAAGIAPAVGYFGPKTRLSLGAQG
jgi:hypothetical protein